MWDHDSLVYGKTHGLKYRIDQKKSHPHDNPVGHPCFHSALLPVGRDGRCLPHRAIPPGRSRWISADRLRRLLGKGGDPVAVRGGPHRFRPAVGSRLPPGKPGWSPAAWTQGRSITGWSPRAFSVTAASCSREYHDVEPPAFSIDEGVDGGELKKSTAVACCEEARQGDFSPFAITCALLGGCCDIVLKPWSGETGRTYAVILLCAGVCSLRTTWPSSAVLWFASFGWRASMPVAWQPLTSSRSISKRSRPGPCSWTGTSADARRKMSSSFYGPGGFPSWSSREIPTALTSRVFPFWESQWNSRCCVINWPRWLDPQPPNPVVAPWMRFPGNSSRASLPRAHFPVALLALGHPRARNALRDRHSRLCWVRDSRGPPFCT